MSRRKKEITCKRLRNFIDEDIKINGNEGISVTILCHKILFIPWGENVYSYNTLILYILISWYLKIHRFSRLKLLLLIEIGLNQKWIEISFYREWWKKKKDKNISVSPAQKGAISILIYSLRRVFIARKLNREIHIGKEEAGGEVGGCGKWEEPREEFQSCWNLLAIVHTDTPARRNNTSSNRFPWLR